MKAEILALLRERADYISGQELCERFQVSRTAVWKAIGQLKKEGYVIEAVQNRGYRLAEEQEDAYGENELNSRIRTRWIGHPARFFEVTASTNLQAKLEAENGGTSGTLIVADKQTAGRGRRGRSWESPAGTNVYFSLLLRPDFSPDKASMLTLVMACAVAEGIGRTLESMGISADRESRKPLIKWPNDIIIDGKKVCGILTEMSAEQDYIQYVVIGTGINVRRQDFPQEMRDRAVCLEECYGQRIPRCELIAHVVKAFEEFYEVFCRTENLAGLKPFYESLLVNRDREVCVLDPKGEFRGTARGINENGELLIELADKQIISVYAGEVSVRGIYGYV